jgi:hypothetical protein
VFELESSVDKYSTVIFYSLRLFSIRDIEPTSILERGLFSALAVISAMVTANVVGNIYVLINELDSKQNNLRQEEEAAAAALTNLNINSDLQKVIKGFMLETVTSKDNPQQLQEFLGKLPQSYVKEVSIFVLQNIL